MTPLQRKIEILEGMHIAAHDRGDDEEMMAIAKMLEPLYERAKAAVMERCARVKVYMQKRQKHTTSLN